MGDTGEYGTGKVIAGLLYLYEEMNDDLELAHYGRAIT